MTISNKIACLYIDLKFNRWMRYFSVFTRVALAAGFLPSGYVKIAGERFTSLPNNQPMGHYLEALFHTGYYYTFIGIAQMTAAVLLLIPRTVVLGALLYFPIILNICILSFSVRFEGSLISSPLMVLANLFLLCWNYDKLRFVFPFSPPAIIEKVERDRPVSNKFPIGFFTGALTTVIVLVAIITNAYEVMPRNSLSDCKLQCSKSLNPGACQIFCESIHLKGQPLNTSLDKYEKALQKGRNKLNP
ncbi:DoxX family protein [Mucilaginibacter sp.]|uniref:DoxX family protein n=1 Tax=Mucilaginibacter sp. TaxID=1882438 RepID=UPI0035BBBC3E